MSKDVFLSELRKRLAGLPQEDIEERLTFYSEMIDDRIEDGLSEEEAVAGIGSIDDIASQIMSEIPLSRIVRHKVKPERKLKGWEIALIIIGFPLWFPLLIAAGAIIFSLYIVIWVLAFSLYAVVFGMGIAAVAVIPASVMMMVTGNAMQGLYFIGMAMICAGIALLLFRLCASFSKSILGLTGKIANGIKHVFVGKREEF